MDLLVTNPINIHYLTGFVGASPEEREAYVLLTKKQTFLFTNALYLEQAKTTNTTVVEISRENPFAKKLGEVINKRTRLGFEETDLTVTEYRKIMHVHKNVSLVPTKDKIEKLRMIKRDDEIENIRRAAKITDECFDFILGKIKPGVSESEVAWEIESFFRKRGAESAFSPIVAFGTHTSQPHYSFTRHSLSKLKGSALKNRDILLFDFGARVNGYCSDMTRVVFIGKPKDEWRQAYETVQQANHLAISELGDNAMVLHQLKKPVKNSGAALDRWIRSTMKRAGFSPYLHSLGHGVGLAIHEAPRLSYKKDITLLPNMIVTIEPAIYVEGSYGIRIEDLVLLKQDGVEVLSHSPKKLTIL